MSIYLEDCLFALEALKNNTLTESERKNPLEAWAKTKNKTVEWASRCFDDALDRKRLGHLNSVADTSHFNYEGGSHTHMPELWEDGLLSLPSTLTREIGNDNFQDLLKGFHFDRVIEEDTTDFENSKLTSIVDRVLSGQTVVVSYGTVEHAVDIVFHGEYVLICNGGYAPEDYRSKSNILAFKNSIEKQVKKTHNKASEEARKDIVRAWITSFLQNAQHSLSDNLNYLEEHYKAVKCTFGDEKDEVCKLIETLSTEKQTVGNCSSFSRSIALLGALVLQQVKDGALTPEDAQKAKKQHEQISAHVRAYALNKYYLMRPQKERDGFFDEDLVEKCLHRTVKHLKSVDASMDLYPELAKASQSTFFTKTFQQIECFFSRKH